MMTISKLAIYLAIALTLSAACGDEDPGSLGTRLSHISVQGEVLAPSGAPVPSAAVAIGVGESKVGQDCNTTKVEQLVTDASGRFGKVIVGGPLAIVACVMVTVTPSAGSGLATKTVRAPDVQFQHALGAPPVSAVVIQLGPL